MRARDPASKFESTVRFEKAGVKDGAGRTAVVIKEFSLEKRSPETRLVEREVGMRSNEWLLLGVLNDW